MGGYAMEMKMMKWSKSKCKAAPCWLLTAAVFFAITAVTVHAQQIEGVPGKFVGPALPLATAA